MSDEKITDAELDAFLRGDDALSCELQALTQPAPSAQLDAAILAQAQSLMEQERVARPPAANDSGPKAPIAPWRPGARWRVPTGIAAALVAGVLAQQTWHSERDADGVGSLPLPSAPAPSQPAAAAPPALPEAPRETIKPSPVPETAAVSPRADTARANHQPAPAGEMAPSLAPAPAEVPAKVPPPAPAPMAVPPPAPAAAASDAFDATARAVTVTARRSRNDVSAAPAAPAVRSAPPAPSAPDPALWLAAIDEMLRAGLRRDALDEWQKFRATYPDYPVPATTSDQIKALR
jgi:hypothetical protein